MSNYDNSCGNLRDRIVCDETAPETEMVAFDQLPPIVREALRNSRYDLSSKSAQRNLMAGHSPQAIAEAVGSNDLVLRRIHALVAWGPDHPEADPPPDLDTLRHFGFWADAARLERERRAV